MRPDGPQRQTPDAPHRNSDPDAPRQRRQEAQHDGVRPQRADAPHQNAPNPHQPGPRHAGADRYEHGTVRPDSFSNVRGDDGKWGLGQRPGTSEASPDHDRKPDAADRGEQKYSTAESMAAERPPENPSEHRWDVGRAGEFERLDVSPELRQKLAGDDGYTGIRNTPSGLSVVHYPKSMIGDRAYYDRVPKPAVDPKRFTVEVHGSPDGVEFRGQQLSAKELAEIIKAAPGYDPGTPIRLLSCKTGADTPDGSPNFAQQLSKELGVEVLAPNKDAWVDNFGNMYASDSRAKFEPDAAGTPQPKLDEPGQWISFAPDGTKAVHDSPFPPGHEPEFTRHGVQAHNAEQRGIGDVFRKMLGLEKKPDTFETDPVTGERHPAPHQAYTQHPQNGQPPFQQPQPGQSPNLPQEWQRQPQAPAQQGQMPYQQGQQPPAVQQQQAGPYPQQQPYPQQPQGGYPQQQGGFPQQPPQNGPGFGQQQPGPNPQGMSNQPGGPQYPQGVGNNQGGPQYPQGAGNQPGGPQYQQGGGYPQPQHPGGMHQQAPGQPQPPVAQPPRGPQQSGPTPPPAAQPPRGPQQPQGMPQQSGRPTFNGPGPQGPHTPAHGPHPNGQQGPRSPQVPGQPAPRPYDVSGPRQNPPGPGQQAPRPNVSGPNPGTPSFPRNDGPPLDVSGPRSAPGGQRPGTPLDVSGPPSRAGQQPSTGTEPNTSLPAVPSPTPSPHQPSRSYEDFMRDNGFDRDSLSLDDSPSDQRAAQDSDDRNPLDEFDFFGNEDFRATSDDHAEFRELGRVLDERTLREFRLQRPDLDHITDEELSAMYIYTGPDFEDWNKALRSGDPDEVRKYETLIRNAVSGMNKLPDWTSTPGEPRVLRGIQIDGNMDEFLDRYGVGNSLTENSFTSTTKDDANAPEGERGAAMTGNVQFVIDPQVGGKDIEFLRPYGGMREVIFPPGTRFEVTHREFDRETNTWIIHMTALGR